MKAPTRSRQKLQVAALAAAAAFAVGAFAAAVSAQGHAPSAPASAVLTYDAGGYRYTYHLITGDESLFDLRADPHELHNLSRTRQGLARELRRALEAELRVDDLGALRRSEADTIRRLRSLGYL